MFDALSSNAKRNLVVAGSLLLIAVLAPHAARAQTPGARVQIPQEELPRPGGGQLNYARDQATTWSMPGRSGSNVGWKHILVADIDGDGRDDLCGLYGLSTGQNVYGCVKNDINRTFSGNLFQAEAFNGLSDASIHSTISVVDLNDNGGKHLCGRTVEGMKCQRFNGTGFDAPVALFPNNPEADFSNANHWHDAQYYSTIGFARLSGKLALCGRGLGGVLCYLKFWGSFHPTPKVQTQFSDAAGWNRPEHFSTLRYVDVDRDGNSDICGRGIDGIVCSVWRGFPQVQISGFEPLRVWTDQFRDIYGWRAARYFTSIRFGDVNADGSADVCGRGGSGLYCGMNTSQPSLPGSFAGAFNPPYAPMSDDFRWGIPDGFLRSFFIIDFDGDGKNDVCGLNAPWPTGGTPDMFCAKSRSTAAGAVFDAPLVTRTKGVAIRLDGKAVVGRLYVGGKTGFCWDSYDGSVSCSVEWR